MSRVSAWFERKFDFSLPVQLYPNLLTRLRGTPARLEELVRGRTMETMVRKENGKWSAQEHAGHLADLEPLWLARVEDFTTGGAELTAADLKNQKTHSANHNAHPVEEILADFRRKRAAMLHRVENAAPEMFARSMLHPRLKQPMRLVDHLYFVAEHDDHHLAQIWELINKG
ncbi:MAG TPA: DinB family protein [Terriglobales bacterium]|nr:DinB family protein [Terriglobales bacterium]